MDWLNKKMMILIVGITLVLMFALLVGFHFFREESKDVTDHNNQVELPNEDDLEFVNDSSMSQDEVWTLVLQKREQLQKLFYESEYYLASQIDSANYKEEDDEQYAVFDDQFLKDLNGLVTDSIYNKILEKMTLLKQTAQKTFYLCKKNAFDSIYLDSAIANVEITEESLRLISATDEVINANVYLSACEVEDDSCKTKTNIPFEIQKIEDQWKVSTFYKN